MDEKDPCRLRYATRMRFISSIAYSLRATLRTRLSIALLRLWLVLARRDVGAARKLWALAVATRDNQAARSASEALLRANPSDAAALNDLAAVYLSEGSPGAALGLYARRARLLGEAAEPRLYRNAYMAPDLVDAGQPYVHVLRDVAMETADCAIFDGDRVYIRETTDRNIAKHPYIRHRITPDREWFVVSCPETSWTMDEPVVLLGTDGAINYSHWLTRHALKLALVEQAGIPSSVPFLINENPCAYQRDLLGLVGIPDDRLKPVPRGIVVRFRELIVPVQLRNHAKMRLGIDWLRNRLGKLIEPAAQARDLLFISRRDAKNHALLNEAEIERELARRGFRTTVLSEMSFADQVRSFSRARAIVGPHGAGLTNLIFAPPGAAVVEITNTKLYPHDDFRCIAAEMGQKFFDIVSDWYPDVQRSEYYFKHDYYVDVSAVLKTVDKILDG